MGRAREWPQWLRAKKMPTASLPIKHREAARLRQAMAPTLGDQAAIREWRIEACELSGRRRRGESVEARERVAGMAQAPSAGACWAEPPPAP